MAKFYLAEESTTPSPPTSGYLALYAKTDNNLYIELSTGTEILISGAEAIVDTGTHASPITITSSISVPSSPRARSFLVGSGAVVDPTLGNGSGTQEWFLVGTSNTNTVQLDSASNLILSGPIILRLNSLLSLQWSSSNSAWIEVSRNEI